MSLYCGSGRMTETNEQKLARFQKEYDESHDYINKLLAKTDPLRGVKYHDKKGELNAKIIGCNGNIAYCENRKQEYIKQKKELEAQLKELEDNWAKGYPIV
jgi:chromosome segregation ATPase